MATGENFLSAMRSAAVARNRLLVQMRGTDSLTLRRWARNETLTAQRRAAATQALRERGIYPESTLCPMCGAAWDAYNDKCPNPNCW